MPWLLLFTPLIVALSFGSISAQVAVPREIDGFTPAVNVRRTRQGDSLARKHKLVALLPMSMSLLDQKKKPRKYFWSTSYSFVSTNDTDFDPRDGELRHESEFHLFFHQILKTSGKLAVDVQDPLYTEQLLEGIDLEQFWAEPQQGRNPIDTLCELLGVDAVLWGQIQYAEHIFVQERFLIQYPPPPMNTGVPESSLSSAVSSGPPSVNVTVSNRKAERIKARAILELAIFIPGRSDAIWSMWSHTQKSESMNKVNPKLTEKTMTKLITQAIQVLPYQVRTK